MASKLKLTELLYPTSTTAAITINSDDSVTIPTQSTTNLAYTGTLTGGTGVVNLGSGQFYKDASGNVGIGTSSPASKLHVSGSFRQTGATAPFEWTVNSGAADFYKLNAVGYADNLFVANSSGNVGIGTASPLARLNVQADNNNSDSGQLIVSGATSSSKRLSLGFNTTSNYGFVQSIIAGDNYYPLVLQPTAGNVGIGTTSPNTTLQVTGDITQTWASSMDRFVGSKFSTSYELGLHFIESSRETRIVSKAADSTGLISFYTGVTPTEKMRLTSDGNLLVGTTSVIQTGMLSVAGAICSQTASAGFSANLTTSSGDQFYFRTNSGANLAGYITCPTASTTSYLSVSDYRLKENVLPMTGALAKIAQLNPCTYTWKADGLQGQGFIAHELQAVVPDCVAGEKDAVDAEGKPKYQGVDTSFLVATLTAAIQEQQALIADLTTRLTALEGN